uniref:Oxygen-evolving enhancer protein 3, chloroplastic n=1 Tax=Onobrychis viciifolia TaxID=3882 RepID=PSBQ_ONOVI|nr:RecName: Full=Oxygen-evolving enhancer protein 3, chloroplastic; Short=OEE3; AltName: Full=16 kDa subunit of oxygen evolving system of photosystem II; AltName: Full=OEC 16 kDa subunit; Flags: Precursor [Onobrychis viciifolia]AAB81994.1 oxygen-evolving enhancer protein 3 precursor [Onobrychis viciifolia]
MAQAMASGLLEGSLQLMSGSNRSSSSSRTRGPAGVFIVRAQQQEQQQGMSSSAADPQSNRRAMLGLVATGLASASFVQAVLAEAKPIKVGGPPPPSGGLGGTLNSDEARDLKLPLKERFYIQPLSPTEAAQRQRESAKEIVAVKKFIDQKLGHMFINDLRLRASYLRYDLNTVISSKPKEQKQSLKESSAGKLFQDIDNLDYAAKLKSAPQAEKYYADAVSTLNDVLSKIG